MSDAIALFQESSVKGEVLFHQRKNGVVIMAKFTKLPDGHGKHGFHIHKAGDLRGEGCKAACDHWHKGKPTTHGGPPSLGGPRHTGDLGNIQIKSGQSTYEKEYFLRDVRVEELYGRSLIVHADGDDYGKGGHDDSLTTGHSGARIACSIIGRVMPTCGKSTTRKNKKHQ